MRAALSLSIFLAANVASACYNDRDTLGFELQNRPNVQRALTGRFDRYPPGYYEVRIARLRAKPSLTPAEYDDLAVALDRIGKHNEALAAIEAKGALSGLSQDERYRFFANRGTIRANRWISDGAPAAHLEELRAAESDIERALELNPHAHFGREGVQLGVMRWLESVRTKPKGTRSLGYFLMERIPDVKLDESLSGLIMLGGAWESPDVALAIAQYEGEQNRSSLVQLAYLRYKELLTGGKKSLAPSLADSAANQLSGTLNRVNLVGDLSVARRFTTLRREAEDRHQMLNAYISARLERGKHPDTDPTFWAEWREPPLPKLPTKFPFYRSVYFPFYLVLGALVLALAGALIWGVWKAIRAVRRRFRTSI